MITSLLWWFGWPVIGALALIVAATMIAALTAEGLQLTKRAIRLSFVFVLLAFLFAMVVN